MEYVSQLVKGKIASVIW